uniref:Uncharacterized protein n=2 Tax=Pyramimonas obovata TaxID=1411642 RepID=A0A7S0N237_9CHLO|mmetsp:Transcript_18821/g.41195  ORF Transcript_18821/g.41195 Transcript_18821/m.41195 type:complete len:436 (+) Transcript_18821:257-1564(+)|eukprot:CAMPEP_0118949602 /NCGR_PEP_ID=MMETSP1169-20130426/49933_1 /TAXON_ID=36882 /ORGANISM="Pyramimonas obovata, Strain CCMP722" /LENGTH=435 /DNA_ID=CAMNT_0006896277 /DNA_START=197 /DNA_END=1504 /DNA_ORIENTATION=+
MAHHRTFRLDSKRDTATVCPVQATPANLYVEDRDVEVRHTNWLYNSRIQEELAGQVQIVKTPLSENHVPIVHHTSLGYHGFDRHEYDDGAVYLGQWVGGIRVGLGVMQFPDGSKYEGEFEGDFIQGMGKYTYVSNNTYVGQYKRGKRDGLGRYKWTNSGQLYNGLWEDDRRSGAGTHFWDDNALYQGKWIMGLQEFNGVFDWPDGRRYIGEVKNGMRHGNGISIAQNGAKIANKWKNGRPTQSLKITAEEVRVGYTAAIVSANEAKLLYTVGSYVYRMAEEKAKEARRMVDTWKRLTGFHERSGQPKGLSRAQLVSGPANTMQAPLEIKVEYLKNVFRKEAEAKERQLEEARKQRLKKKKSFRNLFGKRNKKVVDPEAEMFEAEVKRGEDYLDDEAQRQLENEESMSRLKDRRTDNSGMNFEDALLLVNVVDAAL